MAPSIRAARTWEGTTTWPHGDIVIVDYRADWCEKDVKDPAFDLFMSVAEEWTEWTGWVLGPSDA